MQNVGLGEAQARIKIAGRNINNLRYADDTTLMAENKEELKKVKSLDESERGEWKTWLETQHSKNKDHGIWSHHLMANRWGNNRNSEKLYYLGLQNHCWQWLQPWNEKMLFLGWKAMHNLDSILKSRDITLPTKICLVKAMVFSLVMYGCESWTIKKAEHQRIDAFELWCCRRLLRVPWTARRFNQSILKEISPGCSLEGRMLNWNPNTLAISCEELTHWKKPWCLGGLGQEEKGTTEDERAGWCHRLDGHEFG